LYARCVHRLHHRPWWSRRWFYSALHTLDIPMLLAAPALRTILIVAFCAVGLAFSLSGVVIGWRRLRMTLSSTRRS
jgi:hypothetical protein